MTWLIIALRPFGSLILFGLICLPIKLAIRKWCPPRIASLLLHEYGKRNRGRWN